MSAVAVPQTGRRPLRPALVNLGLGLIFLLAVIPLALNVAQQPPPPIAEFAPSVQQQIKQPQQDSTVGAASQGKGPGAGAGAGSGHGAGPSPTALPTPRPTAVAGSPPSPPPLHCTGVGSPPRTTDDPQSPECLPPWAGTDNGGATWQGVTGSQINVARFIAREDNAPYASANYAQDLLNFFSQHFQTYGRSVVFNSYASETTNGALSTAQMDQDAATVEALKPFADINYLEDNEGQDTYFYDQLAQHQILSMETNWTETPVGGDTHFAQEAPYEWMFTPGSDRVLANIGQFICRSIGLTGQLAIFAGSPQNTERRKVGIVVYTNTIGLPTIDATPLADALQACGEQGTHVYKLSSDNSTDQTTVLTNMKSDGITSVVFLGHSSHLTSLAGAATSQNFYPEWIVSNYIHQDDDAAGNNVMTTHSEQAVHMFGIQSRNKSLPIQDRFSYRAGKSQDPAYSEYSYQDLYYNLMLLFTGIQNAGPHLTPETFQEGMEKAIFPNPGADASPYYQARVGPFGAARHTEIDDFAPIWFNPTAQSVQQPNLTGSYCYIDNGVRYRDNEWPDLTKKLFHQSCGTG